MAKHGDVATGPGWELRLGRWEDVLTGVSADALISDPPFSERTHAGHDAISEKAVALGRRPIDYSAWAASDVAAFVESWSSRISGWMVALTDDVLSLRFREAYEGAGRCGFAPLPFVQFGSRVRLSGDGPSTITTQISVSRPRSREYSSWGTTPGAYVQPAGHHERPLVVGGKTRWIMQSLVRDYSRPGDLICDPCAGGGTTLLAAVLEGRRAIGAELDPVTFEEAVKRLRSHAITPPLPSISEPVRMVQTGLDLDDEEAAQ